MAISRALQGQDKGKTRATIEEGKEGEEGKKVKKKSSKDKILSVVGEEFRAYWNGKDCLPEIRTWDEGREQALMERRNNPDFCEHWREAIDALTRSAFHTGQNDSRWAADVDWFLGGVKKGANWKKCWEKESRLGHGAKQISPGVAQWLINKKGAQGNEPKQP